MRARDENALICDFAETYHVFDYMALPIKQAAILAAGLSANSRIKRKLSGQKQELNTLLLACIADAMRTLVWFKTEDGHRGTNRPTSILEKLIDDSPEVEEFNSPEAYEAARKRIIEGK